MASLMYALTWTDPDETMIFLGEDPNSKKIAYSKDCIDIPEDSFVTSFSMSVDSDGMDPAAGRLNSMAVSKYATFLYAATYLSNK